jgi:hypothetical protein
MHDKQVFNGITKTPLMLELQNATDMDMVVI